jgi:hypothetical protein
MSKRDDEGRVIKSGQAKSYKVNRADDPESFFKFKLRRAHGKQFSGGRVDHKIDTVSSLHRKPLMTHGRRRYFF